MAVGYDDRDVGLGLVFGLLAAAAAGYTLLTSLWSVTAESEAAAATFQMHAAVGFGASIALGALLVAVLHAYA